MIIETKYEIGEQVFIEEEEERYLTAVAGITIEVSKDVKIIKYQTDRNIFANYAENALEKYSGPDYEVTEEI